MLLDINKLTEKSVIFRHNVLDDHRSYYSFNKLEALLKSYRCDLINS